MLCLSSPLLVPRYWLFVLALRYFCDLSPEQIALEYDVAPAEVDEWHRLGLKALARTTEDPTTDPDRVITELLLASFNP